MTRTFPARLVDPGHALTSSLDYNTTLRAVARLTVPRYADWCMAYAPQQGASLSARLAIAHTNAKDEAALRAVWQRQPFELPSQHPLLEVVRTVQPIVVEACSALTIASLAGTAEREQLLRRVGVRSYLAVPLVAHETCVGGLLLVGARTRRRPYTQASIGAVANLASCAAHAIYNARLFCEAKLAVRLRDAVISAASTELLAVMDAVRQRTDRLRWTPDVQPGPAIRAEITGPADIESLADDMQQLIDELRLVTGGTPVR